MPDAGWRELWALLIRRRKRFSVTGPSMEPTLRAGDGVLIDPRARIAELDVVCARHPNQRDLRVVKRVQFIDEQNQCYLASDNSHAIDAADSRSFGLVPMKLVLGRVTCRVR